MTQENEKIFVLDLRLPDAPPQRIRVQEKMILGQGDEADIQLKGHGLPKKALTFRPSNNQLNVLFHTSGYQWQNKEMTSGRQILLDKGDKITLFNVEIFIREEEVSADDFETSEKTSLTDFQKVAERKQEKRKKEETNNLNFFQRLKSKWSEKKKVEDIKKAKAGKSELLKKKTNINKGNDAPNPFYRLLGFQAQWLLCFNAYQLWLKSVAAEYQLDAKLQTVLLPVQEIASERLQGIIEVPAWDICWRYNNILYATLLYIILEVIFSLLLGIGPVAFFMGMTTDGGQLSKRFKATFRTIFSIPLSLLIVPALPSLFGKRSMAEVLTRSTIVVKTKLIHNIVAPILGLLLLITAILLPTLEDMSIYEHPLLNLENVLITGTSNKNEDNAKKSLLQIPSLLINTAQVFPDDIDFVPLIKDIGIEMMIVDLKKAKEISIKTAPAINWANWAIASGEGDPLATIFAPQLYHPESPEFFNQFAEKLKLALSMHPLNAIDYFVGQGFFLYGNIKLRLLVLTLAEGVPLIEYTYNNNQYTFALTPLELKDGQSKIQILRAAPKTSIVQILFSREESALASFALKKIIMTKEISTKDKIPMHPVSLIAKQIESIKQKKKLEKSDLEILLKYFKTKSTLYAKSPELKKIFSAMMKRNLNQLQDYLNKKLSPSSPEQKLWSALQQL
jgi:hypothetical protein